MQGAQNQLPENAVVQVDGPVHIIPVGPPAPLAPLGQEQPVFAFGPQVGPPAPFAPLGPSPFSFALSPAQTTSGYVSYLRSVFAANNIDETKIDTLEPVMIKNIYDLFYHRIIKESTDYVYLKFVALYYKIAKNMDKMKEFYVASLNHGCSCMNLSNVPTFDFTDMFRWPHLRSLFLINNKLDVVDDTIGNLKGLIFLDLSKNNIKVLPDWIGSLSNLTGLNVSNNQLTVLPEPLYELKQLKLLLIFNNQLTSVSDSIVTLTQLDRLSVSYNQLSTFPEGIEKLSNLKMFDIAFNQLSAFPTNLCSLSSLEILNLSNNKIQSVPENIGDLISMVKLNISNNQFTLIPDSIGKLANMTSLSIHRCPIRLLPDSICNLTQLTTLNTFPNFLTIQENKDHCNFTYVMAKYYSSIGNEEQMIKYYSLENAGGNHSIDIINILLRYYKKNNIPQLVIHYIIQAITTKISFVIDDEYQEYIQSITDFAPYLERFIIELILRRVNIGLAYSLYKKFNIRVPKVEKTLAAQVVSFIQLIDNKMKHSTLEDCPLCYKNTKLILYDCFGHSYCLDCMYGYVYPAMKCPQCQINPTKINNKKRTRREADSTDEE